MQDLEFLTWERLDRELLIERSLRVYDEEKNIYTKASQDAKIYFFLFSFPSFLTFNFLD